jgi:hypothetical protein
MMRGGRTIHEITQNFRVVSWIVLVFQRPARVTLTIPQARAGASARALAETFDQSYVINDRDS